jgi:hypothetical protein
VPGNAKVTQSKVVRDLQLGANMILTRRRATVLTISAGFVPTILSPRQLWAATTSPQGQASLEIARHNSKDALYLTAAQDKTRHHEESGVKSEKDQTSKKGTPDHLEHTWKAEKSPPHGGTTVIIDKEGNYSFSAWFNPFEYCAGPPASIPKDPMQQCPPGTQGSVSQILANSLMGPEGLPVAIAFALSSSLGYVMTWAAGGFAYQNGLSWTKQGHDPIVKDLWPDVVKGHKWYGTVVYGYLTPARSPTGATQEGNSALGDVAGALGTVGAVILSLF